MNDNPNTDYGEEDLFLKGKLYNIVIEDLVQKIEAN
jgi:hypothetical protein